MGGTQGGRAAMGLHEEGGKGDKEGGEAARGLRWILEKRRNGRCGGGGGTGMGGRAAMGLQEGGEKGIRKAWGLRGGLK